jgi:CRISPR/Cas system-associated endonuclease Cas1
VTPAHALLNYAYAILETEATIAAYALGFDPSLGLMHSDQRYRTSLATDLMEPARPIADALLLARLEERELHRGDVVETRSGVCRLGPSLTREIAMFGPDLQQAVAPHAEDVARTLLARRHHPTPLTRANHSRAVAGSAGQGSRA